MKTFPVALYLICILLHDAVRRRERRKMKAGHSNSNGRKDEGEEGNEKMGT